MMKRSTLSQFSRRPVLKSTLGLVSLVGTMSSMLLTQVVQAQTPSEMALYTNIAQQIERQRRQDYLEVQQLLGGKVPDNVCQQSGLAQPVRKVCDRFDATSRDIITRNGMSIPKFNDITRYCQQSPKPKECPK